MVEAFHLDAWLRSSEGALSAFSLSVSAPHFLEPGKFGCTISCSHFPFDGREFYGGNARQAMALALWLIEDQLLHEGMVIVDAEDGTIDLPIDREAGVPDTRK